MKEIVERNLERGWDGIGGRGKMKYRRKNYSYGIIVWYLNSMFLEDGIVLL